MGRGEGEDWDKGEGGSSEGGGRGVVRGGSGGKEERRGRE